MTVADMLQARASKRAAKAEERRAKSEKLKEDGNTFYRSGDYLSATECYQKAIAVHGPTTKPVLLTNLAATYLKLEMFAEAHFTAGEALIADPKSVKARFRRGVARQEMNMLPAAAADFRTVLRLDPGNKEAESRLDFVEELYLADDGLETDHSDDEYPSPSEELQLEESVSESSDCEHEGNGVPCKFYNHDGCAKGSACRFSHAPDSKSERDSLGKNVCSYFLMGICRFGDHKCSYSHSRDHLPEKGWWTTQEGIANAKEIYKLKQVLQKDVAAATEEYVSTSLDSGKGKASRNKKSKSRRNRFHTSPYGDWDSGKEMTEFGFTESDVEELLCQGVKPWDEDAHDALAILRGF
ncbi:TPR-like protein [Gyrodon lividus]|nr:TPR-like protein [Gyrodon lividus]